MSGRRTSRGRKSGGAKQSLGMTKGFDYNNSTTGFAQIPAFRQQNTSLFGGAQSTTRDGLFGSTAAPAFGSAAAPAFGSRAAPAFGGPAAAPAFGSTAAPAFGGPAAATQFAFGGVSQNTSLFGSNGQQNTAGSSLFGQSCGSQTKTKGLAFPTQSSSLFGHATTSTAPAFGGFGKTETSGGGMTGATPSAFDQTKSANPGTSIAKYRETIGTDTVMKNDQTNNVCTEEHCIPAKKEYKGKSLEELRMEDYLANRKDSQQGVGLFGQAPAATGGLSRSAAPQQTTGLFGQQPENKGLFGAAPLGQTPGFGQTAGFGATSQASTGLFGKPFSALTTSGFPSAFGQTNNDNPGTSIVKYKETIGNDTLMKNGQACNVRTKHHCITAMKEYEGKPLEQLRMEDYLANGKNPQQGVGLFGQAPVATGRVFGSAVPQQTTGLSGQQPKNNGVFGAPLRQKPGFAQTAGFGATCQPSTGLFAKPTTYYLPFTSNTGGTNASKKFGSNPFGQTQSAGPFSRPATTSAFGQTTTGFGTFATANTQQPNLFGSTAATSTPAFGGLNTATSTFSGFGTNTSTAAGELFGNKPATGFGATSGFGTATSTATSGFEGSGTANEGSLFNTLLNKTAALAFGGLGTQTSTAQLGTGINFDSGSLFNNNANKSGGLFGTTGQTGTTPNSKNVSAAQSIAYTTTNAQSTRPESVSGSRSDTPKVTPDVEQFNNEIPSSLPQMEVDGVRRESWLHPLALDRVKEQNKLSSESVMNNTLSELVSRKTDTPPVDVKEGTAADGSATPNKSLMGATYVSQTSNDSLTSSQSILDDKSADASLMNMEPHPTGIILHRKGYYTIPSLDKLNSYLADDGTCVVPNFTIGRQGYGNVFFDEPIDVAGINLDEIVHFRYKEFIIYPDDKNRPPLGSGLNRSAQITLDQVWPRDKMLHEPIKDPNRLAAMDYEGKLRRICDKHDTRFIEYRPETGSWVFKVDHFSKYGASDSNKADTASTDPKEQKNGSEGRSKAEEEQR